MSMKIEYHSDASIEDSDEESEDNTYENASDSNLED